MLCPHAARFIIMVLLVLVPTMFMYIRPSTALAADRLVILFNIVMPPLLNPLIYTLRNSEVENAMRKIFRVKGGWGGPTQWLPQQVLSKTQPRCGQHHPSWGQGGIWGRECSLLWPEHLCL